MTRPLTIAIFTGSRAWEMPAHRPSRGWVRRQVAGALYGVFGAPPDVVAHGDAVGLDTYVEDLARYLQIPRVVFPLATKRGGFRGPETRNGAEVRPTVGGEDFTYNGPVERTGEGIVGRNGAMARWGRAQLERGHDVYTVALVAPWSLSGGTKNATREFREAGLLVIAPEAPPWVVSVGPDDCDPHGGRGDGT